MLHSGVKQGDNWQRKRDGAGGGGSEAETIAELKWHREEVS